MNDFVISVDSTEGFFNAPAVNPFSENPLEVLGMSGLEYLERQLQARRRDWKQTRLVVRLPPEQATREQEEQLRAALHRHCEAKIQDNRLEIHLIRFRSSIGLGVLLAFVAVIVAAAYFLFTGPLASTPQAVQFTIAATISLFAWVSLWDPLEALLFNPIPLMRENFILRRIIELPLTLQADVSPIERQAPSPGSHALIDESATTASTAGVSPPQAEA